MPSKTNTSSAWLCVHFLETRNIFLGQRARVICYTPCEQIKFSSGVLKLKCAAEDCKSASSLSASAEARDGQLKLLLATDSQCCVRDEKRERAHDTASSFVAGGVIFGLVRTYNIQRQGRRRNARKTRQATDSRIFQRSQFVCQLASR